MTLSETILLPLLWGFLPQLLASTCKHTEFFKNRAVILPEGEKKRGSSTYMISIRQLLR